MITLTEKDKLQDLLSEEKNIVKVYSTFLTEASITELRDLFKSCMFECSDDQFEVFQIMKNKNYYSPKQAQPTEIMQTKTSFENIKNSISNSENN